MRHKRIRVKTKPTYRVRGADGTRQPFPRGIIADGGARPIVFTPETIVVVKDCVYVRRRIAAGDFVEVEEETRQPWRPPAADVTITDDEEI